MKRTLCISILTTFLLFLNYSVKSQLPDGSYAKNFIMQDIASNTQNLYSYLDSGKAVFIDVSAVWCSPCWQYHQSGALETAFNSWGPDGTNELMVLWVEGDENPLACLQGTGCNTKGNWTLGTTFPMMLTCSPNTNQINTDYDIAYFPTIYRVCPDRTVTLVGQKTAAQLHTAAQGCPALSVTSNDAKLFNINAPKGSYCSDQISPKLTIQNYGNDTLKALTIISKVDGIAKDTLNWTGSLSRYEIAEVTISTISGMTEGSHAFDFELTSPNGVTDENPANNNFSGTFSSFLNGSNVTVKTLTDDYPSENYWEIKDGSTVVATSEKFRSAEHIYNSSVCLQTDHCYTLWLYDTYGDGMTYNGVSGNVEVIYNGVTLALIQGGSSWTTQKSANFCTATGVEEYSSASNIQVYPNPFNSNTTIEFTLIQPEKVSIVLYNMIGEKVISSEENSYNAGLHSINIDGRNLVQGIYFADIRIGNNKYTKKLTLVK
ncbi:MAG: T9SS type A sorting domain-containing protein [Bacteroidetes bacterium]|nr:T9SS type A sorting domain-containing protein [Bacteroidota bacterium]